MRIFPFLFVFIIASLAGKAQSDIRFAREGRSLVFTNSKNERLRLTPYGNYMFRLQFTRKGEDFLPDNRYEMVASHQWPGKLLVSDEIISYKITTGANDGLSIRVNKSSMRCAFFKPGDAVSFLQDAKGIQWEADTIRASFRYDPHEHFTGLGHGYFGRAGSIDLKNQVVTRNYGRVDGVLMSLCSETQDVQHLVRLKESGMPIVFFDRVTDISDCPTVTTDDYKCGYHATEHLIQKGCKTIAYLSLSTFTSINQKRKQGYMDALLNHNIRVDNKYIVQCENDADKNQLTIKKLLSSKKKPDGVFASVEKLAIATYHVCNEMKIKIPGQLKLISFSNLRTASLLNPPLSTITQPAFEIGKEACELLFRKISKKSYLNLKEHLVINSTLIARGSTGK